MEKLGIEPSLLFAQIVNFLVIVFVLSKLLYKPILAMLEKRKKGIEEGLTLTVKLQEEKEKLEVKRQKVLDDAKKEGVGILDEAKKQAKGDVKKILEDGRQEQEEIIQKGKEEIERLREKMEKDVRKESIDLAVVMAKRILSSVLTKEMQETLISKHVKSLRISDKE